MALENYLLEQLVREATPLVIGQLVGKIQQTASLEFVLSLRRSDNLSIYISLLPARPAFFLTNNPTKKTSNEQSASHLTNFMRKYLTGATLIELIKEPYERRIIIHFSNFDVMGNPLKLTLLLDLMGRSANAHIFVDGVFLASLRELPKNSPTISLLPLQKSTLFFEELNQDRFSELLKNNTLVDIGRQIAGFSPTLVRELVARSEKMPSYQALQGLSKQLSCENSPQIYAPQKLSELQIGNVDLRNNLILSYLNLEVAKGLIPTKFSSLNKATETYFNLLFSLEAFQTKRNALKAKLKAETAKLESLIAKLKTELIEFSQADNYRNLGELLLANLGTLRIVQNKVFLIDYFHPEQEEISLTIAENQKPKQLAEDYFKQYQRAKRGQQAVNKRLLAIEKELASKEQLLSKVLSVLTEADLETLENPFATPKVKENKRSSTSKTDPILGGLRRYASSDGYEILVGRSDKTNEQLTFQIAKASDIWLHTADYPGSHVLIRNPQRVLIPQRTIYEAAQLAAYFSKAKAETNAAVRYTERKNVSRPKKAKPGMALLTDFKTIMVSPQESGSRLI